MIPMLNIPATWAKIKAGFTGGDRFNNPKVGGQGLRFVSGISDIQRRQLTQDTPPIGNSAFSGKTFNAKLSARK